MPKYVANCNNGITRKGISQNIIINNNLPLLGI